MMTRTIFISIFLIVVHIQSSWANEFTIETHEDEELTIHQLTTAKPDAPILIWLTEGYRDRPPFIELTQQLQQHGNEVWVVDIMESYFLTPNNQNARKLTGEGVRSLLEEAQATGRPFTVVTSGRMSLATLRGARLWQLANKPEQGKGNLLHIALFFPNLFDTAEKAGDSLELFPITSASSLPITVFQPEKGTYILRLDDLMKQLETSGSAVYVHGVKQVRDWYFLDEEMTKIDIQARDAIPKQIALMNALWAKDDSSFNAVPELKSYSQKQKVIGLTEYSDIPAHTFTLQDTSGKIYKLEDYRGKVLLLNFWASWCPPCVHEMPSMARLKAHFKDKPFEILAANLGEEPEQVQNFLEKHPVNFPVLLDKGSQVAKQWKVFAYPNSYLIDKEGNVRFALFGGTEWDDKDHINKVNLLLN